MDNALHPNLPPLPEKIKRLRVDSRGYPVPWFVQWFHRDGTPSGVVPAEDDCPDFRVVDARKLRLAVREFRCWTCGDVLGKYMAFVIGPMCAVNRVSSEPPSHRDCAIFAATACPFLTKPKVSRREGGEPDGVGEAGGFGLKRNPGVALVWITKSYAAFRTEDRVVDGKVVSNRGVLFNVGDPLELIWYAEGRLASRAEIMASIDSGIPLLKEAAVIDGPDAERALEADIAAALKLVPEEQASL